MADVGVAYTLTAPGGTIVFNATGEPFQGQDQYYITEIRGLGDAALRTPTDSVALGDGALIHDYWLGAWHIAIEGVMLVQSTAIENDIVEIRNQMEADLRSALRSCLRTDATFDFTPQGQGAVSYTVRYEVPVEYSHADNYHSLQFSFGLIAGADPTGL